MDYLLTCSPFQVKLLITNGGTLTVQEALYAGVPIIGLPMRFDQRQTLAKLQHKGVAQILPLHRLRNDTLRSLVLDTVDPRRQANNDFYPQ